jgi:hypothetical protein
MTTNRLRRAVAGTVTGSFVASASSLIEATSTLEIEIGCITADSGYDQLDSSGNVDLDGALDVVLLGGFDPSVGNSFDIVVASGGVTGEFDTVSLPALDPGEFWVLDYQSNTLALNIVDFILGDMDGNGLVNLADVPLFIHALVDRATYDLTYSFVNADAAGDIDGSGTFDLGDTALFSGPASTATACVGGDCRCLKTHVCVRHVIKRPS